MFFFFSSRRRHTRWNCDWSSDVCSSDLVFEMTGAGLEPVADPAATFLAGRATGVSGSAVTALMEGTRPMRSEERRVGKSVELGGRRTTKKKKAETPRAKAVEAATITIAQ